MPIPQLGLSLGLTDNSGSAFYAGSGAGKEVSRTDSEMKTHTITIVISEKEEGTVKLRTLNGSGDIPNDVEIPIYQMTVTDDKTNETEYFQVTRDTLLYKERKEKKNLWSKIGLKFLAAKNYLFETMYFEPSNDEIHNYDISKYRHLKHDILIYDFKNKNQEIQLFAGDVDKFTPKPHVNYFVVVNGSRFIGDILFREKFLKLTPKIELSLLKRKKIIKSIESDKNGKANKIIYF